MPGFFSNLISKGQLPTVTTEVTFSKQTLVTLSVVVIVTFVVIVLFNKVAKKL